MDDHKHKSAMDEASISIDEQSITLPQASEQNPPLSISQENPITIISQENSTTTDANGFRFQLKPAIRLKLAIEALCDPDFNPTGTGRVDVDVRGFGLTVGNPSTVHAHLWLKASTLVNFQCSNPVVGEMVNLRLISQNLDVQEKDSLTVLHTHGSTQITFNFGEAPTRLFVAELLEKTDEIPVFPFVTIFCEAAIPSNDVDLLINQLFQDERPQIVSVDITAQKVTIVVGRDRLRLDYDYNEMGFDGTRGMDEAGEQRHRAWFFWKHPEMLQKAARLYYAFLLAFATTPPDTVMLRFTLQELGDLIFLTEAFRITPNLDSHLPNLGNNPAASLWK
ncbi:uncharacterized protein LOC141608964 [Silene latifolia]|uniref:uncharacterized protein LOC141608964 n=1 Tax=Silene latifolia TaxID=37657 RepID=UPI003D786509